MGFTHLHVASAFSAHYGVSWPENLVAAALADGADALAITDRDGLYGSVKHLKACIERGIDPILGVDLAILEPAPPRAAHGKPLPMRTAGRIVALARGHDNGAGYAALCRLVTAAHQKAPATAAPKGHIGITREELATHALGPQGEVLLTILLGPGSDIGLATGHRHYSQARTALHTWRSLLGPEALRVEITTHLNNPGDRLSTAHAIRMLRCAASAVAE